MANLALAPVVNAKLYRHFAAVTFALTLCVALFANGEARQVAGGVVDDQRQAAKLRDAEARKFGTKKLGDNRSNGSHASFGSDFDPNYGASTGSRAVRSSSSADAGSGHYELPPVENAPTVAAPAILSPDEMALLSPAEQAEYLKRLRTQGMPPREEEVRDLAAIESGSRARSGGGGGD